MRRERGDIRRCVVGSKLLADSPRFKRFLFDARSVRTAAAFPVPVDTGHMVGQTVVLAVESGHTAHLPDRFPTLIEAVDTLAHIFDTGTVVVVYLASVAFASGSANAPGAR